MLRRKVGEALRCKGCDDDFLQAMFQIVENKAPGSDGFSSLFFEKAWRVVGNDVCKAVREFFVTGKMLKEINSTLISLIPKIQTPDKVMAAPVIPISSNSSGESVVAPEVGEVSVTSPTGVLDLVDYSSSDSDLSEDSLPLAPELPLVSPFLCYDDSKVDSKSEPVKQRPKRHESLAIHDVMVLRCRVRVTSKPSSLSGSSSHDTFAPSSEFPIAPKIVGPFPARRLAWRRVSHCSSDCHSSPDFTLDSSSSGLSSDSSSDTSSGSPSDSLSNTSSVHSSGCDASGQTHSGSSTKVASSRSTPLSTPYPLTTSESSLDSSSERSLDSASLSAGPSRKRCRSPTTLVPFILTRGKHRGAYGDWSADAEAVVDMVIGDGVEAHTEDGIGMGVEIVASDIMEDDEEFKAEASAGGTTEIALEAGQLMASGERAGLTDWIKRLGLENLKVRALLCIERDGVDNLRHHIELSHKEFHQIRRDHDNARRRLRRLESFVKRHLGFRPYFGSTMDMTITRFRMTPEAIEELIAQREWKSGDRGNNGNGNLNENGRGAMLVARVCTYQDFMKCQPLNFKKTEGVVGLTRWFEKIETMFHISNCPEVYQVKYATCTLLNSALTWWNSHKRTVGVDDAFDMTWRDLIKLMTKVYYPRNNIQKMETELWNLTVKNNDLASYTQ
ncbi:reverse transcriptase domain-containing protein [Tanacetum coccineum]